ncbi:MAG: response regulator [Thermodesulfobacteriota bacterium]
MTAKETLKSRKILLVDDDQSIRHSLSYYFRKKVGSFMALETGEQALDHLKDEAYDVIVCDYRLPGMSGLDFFQELHRQNCRALKILITAFGNLEVAVEAIKMGVHDFIMKPFNAATVEQSITGLIDKQEKEIAAVLVDGKMLGEMKGKQQKKLEFLMGKVSHRMNNLLQGVLGNAEIGCLEARESNLLKTRFDYIIYGLEQVISLNKNLVNINKTLKAEPERFDVVALILSCIFSYNDLIKKYGININRHFDRRFTINTDKNYLTDILDNILLNAIQALNESNKEGNKEEKTLDIYIKEIGSILQIKVIDNGPGMEPEVLEKAVSRGFTTKPRGNGMGLYIAHRLAQEIGAAINIRSEKGKGTEVDINLPQFCREKPS